MEGVEENCSYILGSLLEEGEMLHMGDFHLCW